MTNQTIQSSELLSHLNIGILSPAQTRVISTGLEIGDFRSQQIADEIGGSIETVHTHRNDIARRLGTRGIAQAVHTIFWELDSRKIISQSEIDKELIQIMPPLPEGINPHVTKRQIETVQAMVVEPSHQLAADRLFISINTLGTHRKAAFNSFRALGIRTGRTEVYLAARRLGMIGSRIPHLSPSVNN